MISFSFSHRLKVNIISVLFIVLLCYNFLINVGCKGRLSESGSRYRIDGLRGKVAIKTPDTIRIFKKDEVIVRISKLNINDGVFLTGLGRGRKEILITDTLLLSPVMTVNLKESTDEKKVEIVRLNNNSRQIIDTTKYTEWKFSVRPIDYGEVTLIVSISASLKTRDFGNEEFDIPVFVREVEIFATSVEKFKLYWNKYYWVFIIVIFCIFLIIHKLIPQRNITEYYMLNSKQTNFWNAGSLGLVVYVITIGSIVVFKLVDINLIYVPLVFAGTILIYTVFTAVSLKASGQLSEKNFLELMGMALKKLPPLNLIYRKKDNTEVTPDEK